MPSVIFSKAAAELHTTQSAVSQTMRRLEDELAHLPLLMAPRNALGEHLEAQADSQTIIDCDDDPRSSLWPPPASARPPCQP